MAVEILKSRKGHLSEPFYLLFHNFLTSLSNHLESLETRDAAFKVKIPLEIINDCTVFYFPHFVPALYV